MAIGVIDKPRTEAAEPPEGRVVLHNITWQVYVELLRCRGPRRGTRFTLDRGRLEIMTLSLRHESWKKLVARFLEYYIAEMEIDIRCGGQTTCLSEDLEKGLEPDECYWIQHEAEMHAKDSLDLAEDPPPDLVVEVEVSRSVLDRLGIYAAFGVPEIWKYDGDRFSIYLLNEKGVYVPSQTSRALPKLAVSTFAGFLTLASEKGEADAFRAFRDWVREEAGKKDASRSKRRKRS